MSSLRRVSSHLITTEARPGRCSRCGSWVLAAISEGLPARADPYPLDRLTETLALLRGRWCYTLTGRALIRRDGAARPGHVLAEHICGQPIGTAVALPPPAAPESADPPY